jgi:hypothetical protein
MINRFSTKEKNKVDTPKPQSNQQDQNRQEPTNIGGKTSETNTEKTPLKKLPSNLIGLRPSYR